MHIQVQQASSVFPQLQLVVHFKILQKNTVVSYTNLVGISGFKKFTNIKNIPSTHLVGHMALKVLFNSSSLTSLTPMKHFSFFFSLKYSPPTCHEVSGVLERTVFNH